MPGLSVWLVPKRNNIFTKTLQDLITSEIPRQFYFPSGTAAPPFEPHVTLTSDVDIGDQDPQQWLDSLPVPDSFKPGHDKDEVLLILDQVVAEDPFFRKMNIALSENDNLRALCAAVRKHAGLSESFATDPGAYRPHLSLLYADLPTKDVRQKVPLIESKIGFAMGDVFACCGGSLCLGGEVVLVDTRRPVGEWGGEGVVARREAGWVTWRATRNLL